MRLRLRARWSALFLLLVVAQAQSLEVASVKPSHETGSSNMDSQRGRMTATNIMVRELIRLAFTVQDFQISGAPGWVDAARFDIAAKASGGAGHSMDDLRSLIRELLTSRFQLRTHLESREIPALLLSVGKGAPKLTPHDDAHPRTRAGCGRLVGRNVTAAHIATMLSRQLQRPVIDRTGLTGEYDIQLDFAPDPATCGGDDPSGAPSLFAALQEQLGLRLDSGRGPVEFLVIDRIERPGDN